MVKDSFKKYLFAKGYFVATEKSENAFESVLGLAEEFNIIVKGEIKYADVGMIKLAEEELGSKIPEAFYKNFPQSVNELTRNELYFDQAYAYFLTYGLGEFDEAKHSVFEKNIERVAFEEKTDPKYFTIVFQDDAEKLLRRFADELLCSTRPLSKSQYELAKDVLAEFDFYPKNIAGKNTAIKLLLDTADLYYANFLQLSDVIKVAEELNYANYGKKNIKKLNLRNQDRKFITRLIDKLANGITVKQLCLCEEKRQLWKGLLYHIHYKAHTSKQTVFVDLMQQSRNTSVMHFYEENLKSGNVAEAAKNLHDNKGSAAVLRALNRLLSACKTNDEFDAVLNCAFDTNNKIILLQLLFAYDAQSVVDCERRTFEFAKFNLLKTHRETKSEASRRQTMLTKQSCDAVKFCVRQRLESLLKGSLGKVYIDESMKKVGVPLQESTGNCGYGVLPLGTRLPLDGKIVRCFTYWENVNDIDLSAIAITEDGKQLEFSWRNFNVMYDNIGNGHEGIAFSGDQTAGYNGGSEFIDIDIDTVKARRPEIKYVVFCNNVFSGVPFAKCICHAGFMFREKLASGEIFEPKAVKTSFAIAGDSTFTYLFALDLQTYEVVWLNVSNDRRSRIAGTNGIRFLVQHINSCNIFNMYDLFSMLSTEIVETPEQADVVVSDDAEIAQGAWQEIIRSTNTERILQLINGKTA